jgi:hypothetical protein
MRWPGRKPRVLIASLAAALMLTVVPASPASAQCRAVWVPSSDGGAVLDLLCDGYTGSGGGGGGKKAKKPKKKEAQFGAIAINLVPGPGGTYNGATSAGYTKAGKARSRALSACAEFSGGQCTAMATVRNDWAVLVAAPGPGGGPLFFSGAGDDQYAAQADAEANAAASLGSVSTQLVVGVKARRKEKK